MEFMGFPRIDGSIGVRNHVGIISTVGCINEVTMQISRNVKGTVPFTHQQGCAAGLQDLELVQRTLINIGKNPNLAAVLLISLGCESDNPEKIAEEISKSNKQTELISIHAIGGTIKTVAKGIEIASEMVREASELKRERCDCSKLILGSKCGSSDATSGLSANLAVGIVADFISNEGGTFILSEICDIIGTEKILAQRAASAEVKEDIIAAVNEYHKRGKALGVDVIGINVSSGNRKGGVTTAVEKGIGATVKAGHGSVQEVIRYGDKPTGKGLCISNSPGLGSIALTGEAAAGAQIALWTTGRGAPQGHPIMPVIKITGNINTWNTLKPNIDFNVSGIIDGSETVQGAGNRLFKEVLKVASGKLTKAEILNYCNIADIARFGPAV
jgi:altronate dehydratase large subunit